MDVASFVSGLRGERLGVDAGGVRPAHHRRGGGRGRRDRGTPAARTERRTYTAASGWRWSVYSKAGAVSHSEVVLCRSRLVAPGVGDPGEAAGFESGYRAALAAVRSVLGPEAFEGSWQDVGPTGAWPVPDASRLAWWDLGGTPLCLCINAAGDHLYWLSLHLFPPERFRCPVRQAEPGLSRRRGMIRFCDP